MSFDIPILFIVFNRVDKPKKVFDIIKFIKPKNYLSLQMVQEIIKQKEKIVRM